MGPFDLLIHGSSTHKGTAHVLLELARVVGGRPAMIVVIAFSTPSSSLPKLTLLKQFTTKKVPLHHHIPTRDVISHYFSKVQS